MFFLNLTLSSFGLTHHLFTIQVSPLLVQMACTLTVIYQSFEYSGSHSWTMRGWVGVSAPLRLVAAIYWLWPMKCEKWRAPPPEGCLKASACFVVFHLCSRFPLARFEMVAALSAVVPAWLQPIQDPLATPTNQQFTWNGMINKFLLFIPRRS